MGYYQVVEEIEKLDTNKIEITVKEVANNIGVSERCTRRIFEKLIREEKITRKIVYDKSNKQVFYKLKKNETEGFINGTFKVIADLLHR